MSWHARNASIVGNSIGWAVNYGVPGVGSPAIWENVVVDGNVTEDRSPSPTTR